MSYIVTAALSFALGFWSGRKHAKNPEWFAAKFQSIIAKVKK